MLCITPSSTCDVCFEQYGKGGRVPCSGPCGHVICSVCTPHLTQDMCPFCRTHVDEDSWFKLHVETDSSPDVIEGEQRRTTMWHLAETGASEEVAEKHIQETQEFLNRHPKHAFKDLRVLIKMFVFMCQTKWDLMVEQKEKEGLNGHVRTLSEEKVALLGKLAESEEARQRDRDAALEREKNLRGYYDSAVRNYTSLIQVYNRLAEATTNYFNNSPAIDAYAPPGKGCGFVSGLLQTPIQTLLPALDHALEGVAVRDPRSSFIISPLPQYTGALPSFMEASTPLPDLTEDVEGEEREDEEEEEEEIATPNSIQNAQPMQSYDHGSRQQDYPQEEKASGLSRTAPHGRTRSHSSPNPPSPSRPLKASTTPSTLPQHQTSPYVQTIPYPQQIRESSGSSARPAPDGDALRLRLHNLLSHPASSSLPNIPTSIINYEREVYAHAPSTSPLVPRSSLASNYAVQNDSHPSSSQHAQNMQVPPQQAVPAPRYSSASEEAKRLKEERRRKQEEEKRKEEMERYRIAEEARRREELLKANPNYTVYSKTIATNSKSSSSKHRPTSSGTSSHGHQVAPASHPAPQEYASGHHARSHASGHSSGHKSKPVPIPNHGPKVYT